MLKKYSDVKSIAMEFDKYQLFKGKKVIKCMALVAGVLVSDYITLLLYNADMVDIMANRYNELFGWLIASAIVLYGVYCIFDIITMKGNNLVKVAGIVTIALTARVAMSPVHHRIISACGAYDYMQNLFKVCGWVVIITFMACGYKYIELILRFRHRKKLETV